MKILLASFYLFATMGFAQTLVKNGHTPKSPRSMITFEEDLRIGVDCDQDHCLWSGAHIGVTVDAKGNMYVTDSGSNRVVVYDSQGNFLKIFGAEGEGPGEFTQLYSFQILKDQTGIAFDNNQTVISFSFFDQNQKFKNKTSFQPTERFIQSASFSPDGQRIAAMWVESDSDPTAPGKAYVGLIDKKTKPLIRVTTSPQVMFDQSRMTDSKWWSRFLADWFRVAHQGVGITAFGPNQTFYGAKSTIYEITQYGSDLKPKRIITRKHKPIGLPEDQLLAFVEPVYEEITAILPPNLRSVVTMTVIKRALQLADFPPVKQPIYGLLPVEDKGLLVIHNHNSLTKETSADFFSPEGEFLGTSQLPPVEVNIFAGFFGQGTRMIFQNGFAYTILVTDEGDRHLVRYKYRIKKG